MYRYTYMYQIAEGEHFQFYIPLWETLYPTYNVTLPWSPVGSGIDNFSTSLSSHNFHTCIGCINYVPHVPCM